MKVNIFLVLVFIFSSCDFFKFKDPENQETPTLARVFDKYLYFSEVKDMIPKGVGKEDSIQILERYINSWVKKQLILTQAETNVSFNEAELERRVMDYRYDLVVYEYKKKYILENLDTVVSEEEIEDYYNKNLDNFELKRNIVKSIFVMVPNDAPRLNRVKSLIKLENEEDLNDLKSYCFRFAARYVLEDTIWFEFDEVIKSTPFARIPDKVQFLKDNKYAEVNDSSFTYLINIRDYKISDQQSPLSFVRDQITNIILNKRKVELVNQMEKEIYNQGVKNKEFEIFEPNS